MTKKKTVKRTYSEPLQVRVTTEQHKLFREAAERDGRSVSNWARNRLERAAKAELKR